MSFRLSCKSLFKKIQSNLYGSTIIKCLTIKFFDQYSFIVTVLYIVFYQLSSKSRKKRNIMTILSLHRNNAALRCGFNFSDIFNKSMVYGVAYVVTGTIIMDNIFAH